MQLIIGLVGQQGAGKETLVHALEPHLAAQGLSVAHVRFSDVLRETLTLWGIPHGRENEQLLARLMAADTGFKAGALTRATAARIGTLTADVIFIEGVRWITDETMVRALNSDTRRALIVYVVAGAQTRFERIKARNRSGASTTSWEDFCRQEQAENEIYIADIGSRADVTLANEGSREDFEKAIGDLYQGTILPALRA